MKSALIAFLLLITVFNLNAQDSSAVKKDIL